MDRVAKTTLLLEHADHQQLFDALYEVPPEGYLAQRRARRWKRGIRWIAVAAAALLVVAAGVMVWFSRPPPIRPPAPIPPISHFAPDANGIVLGGPWLGTPEGSAFCDELKARDAGHAVQCPAFPLLDGRFEELRHNAGEAGAHVIGLVEERGEAQVTAPAKRGPVAPDRLIAVVGDLQRRESPNGLGGMNTRRPTTYATFLYLAHPLGESSVLDPGPRVTWLLERFRA
jgi:hypothetical protein